ncbi:MAG: hypothetical protein PUB96_06255 [Helicobacteraceae bacterium]|nr:hypothetical protein [Helicobacteraceae bacterium]
MQINTNINSPIKLGKEALQRAIETINSEEYKAKVQKEQEEKIISNLKSMISSIFSDSSRYFNRSSKFYNPGEFVKGDLAKYNKTYTIVEAHNESPSLNKAGDSKYLNTPVGEMEVFIDLQNDNGI